MTSLLGRLLRLFPESVPLEDLFTEAVAHLFETKPQLCLAWLEEAGLIAPLAEDGQRYIRVESQKPLASLEHHDTDSRLDLYIEIRSSSEGGEAAEDGVAKETVMIESKIGSKEGPEQLRRYAEHLDKMDANGKVLLYITRRYDPKEPGEILASLDDDVRFKQLRWHDFYRFLLTVEKDTLVEEVMEFMEEQRMARSYRFSAADLIALSGVPRAFEIFDETLLRGEVRAELESFAGSGIRREVHSMNQLRGHGRYVVLASLHDWDLFCFAGYAMSATDGYPAAIINLEARPGARGREASVAAMKRIGSLEGWESYSLDDSKMWAGVACGRSLTDVLQEEDHVAAVKSFFIESIRQLREELAAFKKERPDLPWTSG